MESITTWRIEQLKSILRTYYERIKSLEDKKYDVEYIVKRKDIEVLYISYHTLYRKQKLINASDTFMLL